MSAKMSRLEQKLEACLARGDFYEAHQIYRTLFYRLSSQEKYDELVDLLHAGAMRLIQADQFSSATDLAELYMETLQKRNAPISTSTLDHFEAMFSSIPGALSTDTPTDGQHIDRRSRLLQLALKWSQQVATRKRDRHAGHPDLHRRIALVFWHERNYDQSRTHFLLSNDAESFASFLIEFHQRCGFTREVDLFISQAVLQILCQKRARIASTLLQQYTVHHPQISETPPYRFPLLNFIWLLTLCVELRKVTYFSALVEQYQPALQRDPSYRTYLDKIGQVFFGLPPPKSHQPGGGAFFNIIKGLISNGGGTTGGDNSDGSEDSDAFENAIDEDAFLSAASSAGSLIAAAPVAQPVAPVDIDLD